MSKKRLSGHRSYCPNHGKSSVIFLHLSPTMPKPEHAVPTLEINWKSYFDLLKLVRSVGSAFPRVFRMNEGCF